MFEVERLSDCTVFLRIVIGSKVFTLVSVYAPQSSLDLAEKEKL